MLTEIMKAKIIKIVLAALVVYITAGAFLPHIYKSSPLPRPAETTVLNRKWRHYEDRAIPDLLKIIADPREAYALRIAMLREAESSLDIAYFAVSNTDCGDAFLSELLDAADRGVKVRLLVDAKMGSLSRSSQRILAAYPGIEMAVYNPVNLLKPWTLNESLHDKFIIADNKYLLLGGRNIEPYYFALNGPLTSTKYDWDVFAVKDDPDAPEGDSIVDAAGAYNELLWEATQLKRIKPGLAKESQAERFRRSAERFAGRYPEFYEKELEAFCKDMIRPERVMLLHNPLNEGRKEPWIANDLEELSREAKRSVLIQTPYATAAPALLNFLKETANTVPVYYMTNSFASAKNPPAYSNYYFQRDKFLETGINIYEYQDSDSIHGKSIIIDDHIAIIGSFNLDSRSTYLDTETMLVIDSKAFTESFSEKYEDLVEKSLKVNEDNRYDPAEKDQAARVPPVKRVFYLLVYMVLRPFQYFL